MPIIFQHKWHSSGQMFSGKRQILAQVEQSYQVASAGQIYAICVGPKEIQKLQ